MEVLVGFEKRGGRTDGAGARGSEPVFEVRGGRGRELTGAEKGERRDRPDVGAEIVRACSVKEFVGSSSERAVLRWGERRGLREEEIDSL